MKTQLFKLLTSICCIAAITIGGAAQAATLGYDDASQSAYDDGFANGDDGGYSSSAAFGAWAITSDGVNAGAYIGNSTDLAGGSGGNINTGGESFAFYGHSGQYVNASRSFDSDLATGQTFSIQIAVNYRNGGKGIDVKDGAATIFTLNIGGDTYNVSNVASGGGDLFGNAYDQNTVFTISIEQTSGSGGTWTVTRSGGLTGSASGSYTGVADGLHLYEGATGDGTNQNQLYANNLSIVPEPSTLVALISGIGMLAFRRRRN